MNKIAKKIKAMDVIDKMRKNKVKKPKKNMYTDALKG